MSKEESEKQEELLDGEEDIQEEQREQNDLQVAYDQLKDQYLRANAEFENIKKRLEKEKISAMAYANETFAKDLLDVLDAMEAALKVEASDEASLKIKEGVQNTLDLFLKKLEKHGVKEIGEVGGFDPNLHEAMFHVDSEEAQSGDIVAVLQKGYRLNERVIRPTKVSVAK